MNMNHGSEPPVAENPELVGVVDQDISFIPSASSFGTVKVGLLDGEISDTHYYYG